MNHVDTGATIVGHRYATDEFLVNDPVDYSQDSSSVAVLSGGGYVVAFRNWMGSNYPTYGRAYDASGNPVGPQFRISETGSTGLTELVALPGGRFVAIWESANPYNGGGGWSVRARIFESDGSPVGESFQVNSYDGLDQVTFSGDFQGKPAAVSLENGNIVVTWISQHQDGNRYGVFGQLIRRNYVLKRCLRAGF
jgi:hypothetical protein